MIQKVQYTLDQERRLVKRIDHNILPFYILYATASYICRGNLTDAFYDGMDEDLDLEDEEYQWSFMIYFVTYALVAIPSNASLRNTSPRFWLSTLMGLTGVVVTMTGATALGLTSLLLNRGFLGVVEAGLLPGLCYLLTMWYKPEELQYRVALLISLSSFIGSFGSLLSWAMSTMDKQGKLEGWRWIFILQGLLTTASGCAGYIFLRPYPSDSPFLTPNEKKYINERVADTEESDEWKLQGDRPLEHNPIYKALTDWQVWCHAAITFCLQAVYYGLYRYLPILLRETGHAKAGTQLLVLPVNFLGTVCAIFFACLGDVIGIRSPILLSSFLLIIIGYVVIILSTTTRFKSHMTYSGSFLVAIGVFSAIPCSIAWMASNIPQPTKRHFALAAQIGIAAIGSAIGIGIYNKNDAPSYSAGHYAELLISILGLFITAMLSFLYSHINKRRAFQLEFGTEEVDPDIDEIYLGDKSPYFVYKN